MQIAVIGSGLSGLACARALIRRGIKPILIDVGVTLEPSVEAVVNRLKVTDQGAWNSDDVAFIRRNDTLRRGGIPRKLVFGSDFVYGKQRPEASLSGEHVAASMSFAKGGFGNAWGASVLPADIADLEDWPAATIRLDPHYRAVMTWLPLSAREDGLARHFHLFTRPAGALDLTPQGETLRRDLASAEDENLCFGQARLAVHTTGERACRYCGLCLSGCVFGSIFSPAEDVDRLVREGALEYRAGWIVLRAREDENRVILTMLRFRGNTIEEQTFDRAFLAAGAISSTRIMLQSLEACDRPVELHDSQKFLLPLFRWRAAPYSIDHMNSLAALFLELRIPELDNKWMHVQLSTVNDFLVRYVGVEHRNWREIAFAPLLKRSVIAWCSLHSRHSASMVLTLKRKADNTELHVDYARLDRARRSVTKAVKALARAAPRFRSFIVPWLTTLSPPGAGNHLAGSFPMRANPTTSFEADVLGRPLGFQKLHLVDSAVMPSVPATTIALLMMANADRIAMQVPLD